MNVPKKAAEGALVFIGAVVLMVVLAACGSTFGTSPTPELLSGRAQGWTDGRAVVRVFGYDGKGDSEHLLAEGTIGPDGTFRVTLPVIDPASKALSSPAQFYSCNSGQTGTVEVSPDALEVALVDNPVVFVAERSDAQGELLYWAHEEGTLTQIDKLYASTSGTIKGTCKYSGSALTETVTFDLVLKVGWNDVVYSSFSAPGTSVAFTRTGEVPAGVAWQYAEYTPLPNVGS